jgi:saccharopine dehydrogenase-like NADP-dependent oxidoreductase
MKKIIVFGCGRVGTTIAMDLSKDYNVTAIDRVDSNFEKLNNFSVTTKLVDDLNDEDIDELVKDFDLVIVAVPGYMGYVLLQRVIKTGKNVVDISFFGENSLNLDELAKSNNSIVAVDCGVAPGMSNMILGHQNKNVFTSVQSYECLVGGLPKERIKPFDYKAPFSPIDVIEEYTRPARYFKNGELVFETPLENVDTITFPGVGTLESFVSDGLRTLLDTHGHIPNMVEKTLRYPGHIQLMKIFKETGLFSKDIVNVNGHYIKPIDFTSKLLFPKWKLEEDDDDITIMIVETVGDKYNKTTHQYDTYRELYTLYDENDREYRLSSMSRTTGYVCSAVARLIIEGEYINVGINTPEEIGSDKKCFEYIMSYLKQRNVTYNLTSTIIVK